MDNLAIHILVDNTAGGRRVRAEHGLAMLIEAAGRRILFDTGQSGDILTYNAEVMGIPLDQLDAVVFSHGHYDHTGGIRALMSMAHKPAILVGQGVFAIKWARDEDGSLRKISCPFSQEELTGSGFSLPSGEAARWAGVSMVGGFSPLYEEERLSPRLLVEVDAGGTMGTDPFAEEQVLVAEMPQGLAVVAGCSHCGIVGTLHRIRDLFPGKPIAVLIGGFHLENATGQRMFWTAQRLEEFGVGCIIPLHCTGPRALATLLGILGDRVLPGAAGQTHRF